jgi:hypothetical protein
MRFHAAFRAPHRQSRRCHIDPSKMRSVNRLALAGPATRAAPVERAHRVGGRHLLEGLSPRGLGASASGSCSSRKPCRRRSSRTASAPHAAAARRGSGLQDPIEQRRHSSLGRFPYAARAGSCILNDVERLVAIADLA